MFLLDDIALSPFKGFMFIAREVANAVEQERESQRHDLMSKLTELHRLFENGEISDEDFDDREAKILDYLDELQRN